MNNWFTVRVKYTKQLDNGALKRVSEPYLLAAMTFTDAEARIYEELGDIIRGEFNVVGISPTEIHDIFAYDDSDIWYKCKVKYESMDADTEKARKVTQVFLVSAASVREATERIEESLSTLMVDFEIPSVIVSPIVEIFPYNENLDRELSRTPIDEVEETEERISPKYLMTLHPKITSDDAISLVNFSIQKSIRFKSCYGDGSVIFPKWEKHIENAQD